MPVTPVPGAGFDSISAEHRLRALLGSPHSMPSALLLDRDGLSWRAAFLYHAHPSRTAPFSPASAPVRPQWHSGYGCGDARQSRMTRTLAGERKGSLLLVIDMTVTAGGARLLATRLATPLSDHVAITNRLDDVSFLPARHRFATQARECLAQSPDIERGLARLSVPRRPRDLAAIRDGILQARQIAKLLIEYRGLDGLPKNIRSACDYLASDDSGLSAALQEALADDLPLLSRDGCFIRPGFSPDLDENRARDETKQVIAALQGRRMPKRLE